MPRPAAIHRLIQAGRAATVLTPGPRAFLAELGSTRTGRYRLRHGRIPVIVRHRTRDVEILNEIFSHHGYAPPPEVVRRLSTRALTILDLGGNVGLFGAWAQSQWNVRRLDSYEPDPANAAVLERVAAQGSGADWRVHREAVSNVTGELSFVAGAFSESRIAEAGDGETIEVPVLDLFALDLTVDLLKLDIEGAEWPILGDRRLADLRAEVLVMEYHRRGCPDDDAHAAALNALTTAGYAVVSAHAHRGTGTVWAMRPAT